MLTGQGTAPDRTTVASSAKPDGFVDPPAGRGMKRYLRQALTWTPCDQFECAKVRVPLDWDQPDGQAITLAMRKAPASDNSDGTLFINPGGPGGSGQDFVSGFPANVVPGYDVIGWDPRGSGESTPVRCGAPQQTDAYLELDQSPDNATEWQALRNSDAGFARQCRQASGALLDHISTIDNVRDLDYLRYLVGDASLHYMGVSYGTFIGATYAELYPKRVGRMVLDSAVNITGRHDVIQAQGFDLALGNFATWCAAQKCALGTSKDAVMQRIRALVDALDARPLAVGQRRLTQSLGVTGIASLLYGGVSTYPKMRQALEAAVKGDGTALLAGADEQDGRKANGSYDAMTYAFPGIGCKDSSDLGWAKDAATWPAMESKAPFFGRYDGPPVSCDLWSARPTDQLDITAKGAAAPIVVLGTTGDPATPYQQAVSMAHQLSTGQLVTWKGAGHSAFFLGNDCVHEAVLGYLNDGQAPQKNLTC